ncbi:hypothetical protein [Serratia marcescens]|nr:hypothetical protein [Serratia marcescens]
MLLKVGELARSGPVLPAVIEQQIAMLDPAVGTERRIVRLTTP